MSLSVATSLPTSEWRLRLALLVLTLNIFSVNTVAFMLGPLLLPIATEFGTTVAVVGQLAAITSIPWAIAGFFGGPLSDRWGRRPMLLGGNLMLAVCTFLSGFTFSYGSLLAARFVTGLAASPIGVNISATTADLVPPERRGSAMGWVMMGQSLATVVGVPLVSVVAALFGWRATFWAVGGLVAIILVGEYLLIPRRKPGGGAAASYLQSFRQVIRLRTQMIMSVANLFERAAYGVFTVYLAAFIMQTYGLDLAGVAPVLSVAALGMLAGTFLGGRLTDRFGSKRRLAWSTSAAEGLVLLPLFFFTPALVVTVGFAFLSGLMSGSTRPVYLWLLTNVDQKVRGTLMGVMVVFNQGGLILGAGIGGLLLTLGSYSWLGLIGAAAGLVAALLVSRIAEPEGAAA